MILIGIDPGLAHCGVAILEGNRDAHPTFTLKELIVFETKPGRFHDRVMEHLEDLRPIVARAHAIAIEYPSYPPGASAAVKLFSSYVLIATLASYWNIPLHSFLPNIWRRRLDLPARETTEARKADVAELCENEWGASRFLDKIKAAHEEHALDALGVATAWLTPAPSDEKKEIPDEGDD